MGLTRCYETEVFLHLSSSWLVTVLLRSMAVSTAAADDDSCASEDIPSAITDADADVAALEAAIVAE